MSTNRDIPIASKRIGFVATGNKKMMVLCGWRNYEPGPCRIKNQDPPDKRDRHGQEDGIDVHVHTVKHQSFGEISRADMHADGFLNKEDMLFAMQRRYPNMTAEDEVTLVFWELKK